MFRDSFTLQQAQRVLDMESWPDAPWPMFLLEDLLDRSLLTLVPGTQPRFRMLLGVRDFAESKLAESGPTARDAALGRHGLLFADFGSAEAVLQRYGPKAVEATRELLQAAADIRHAMDEAVRTGQGEVAFRNARAWCDIQRVVGHPAEVPPRLERVLSCDLSPSARMALLLQHAMASALVGDWEAQSAATEQGMSVALQLGDDKWVGIFCHCRASHANKHGDRLAAGRHYRDGLAAALRAGDAVNEMVYRSNLAQHESQMGRFAEALALHQETISVGRSRQMPRIVADNQHYAAWIFYELGRPDKARVQSEEASAIHESLGQHLHRLEGEVLDGWLHHERQAEREAAASFRSAVDRAKKHAGTSVLSMVYAEMAMWLAEVDPERALATARRGLKLRTDGEGGDPGLAQLAHARALTAIGRHDEARHEVYAAIRALKGAPVRRRLQARLTHGLVVARQGDHELGAIELEVCRTHLAACGIPDHAPLGREAQVLADLLEVLARGPAS